MQNECCYTLAIRQRTCQNGVARTTDNVYTNIAIGSVISLSFGYSVTIVSISRRHITIQLANNDFIPQLIFNIPVGSYKIFDLPKESGTLRVYIGATEVCCEPICVCCNT